ncbi:HdeD family acid-resistance protein [Streptomyces sp. VRA16 Mangrove soil]|uniref:HdeD family acid-resistance protein n=1 Tax=Streptomyces sp. VRA16 Mangrove soil TaxID=2817434 RepID=UPI001A9E75E1|nr:HdeD family acid-resistance protein [Streptomyces sp. VRA16 Mangrove soil]MBO1332991.1 HdeD family acid-resistance protein [Streptomyces sp. VRA16 Mangrove soil]
MTQAPYDPQTPQQTPDAGGPHSGLTDQGPLGRLARNAWQAVLLMGLSSIILGVLVLVWPGASLWAAGILFGVYLVVSGVFQLIAAFGNHITTGMRIIGFISGALSVLLGLFCFRGAMQSILLLGLWIGIGWLFRGITQTVAAASDPTMPARGWQIFLGVVTALAGIVLIDSPFESVAVLTMVGGLWLLVVGVVEIITAFVVRKKAKNIPQGA